MTAAVSRVVAAAPQRLAAEDPTVCNPVDLAHIQAYYGVQLADMDPQVIRHLVDRSKQAGNEAFKSKSYHEAVRMYSQAIAGTTDDHTLYGNRAAAYLALGLYEEAVWDARKAAMLAPNWSKAYYRLGCALLGLSQWGEAANVLQQGLCLDPSNTDMAAKHAQAGQRAQAEVAARCAQADTERRSIVAQLRAARRKDAQQIMLNQFKQNMAGPDWEVEDLEWRPTFLPAMRLKPVQSEAVLADPKRRMLASYLTALADLAHPKQALCILEDVPRLQAFQQGIAAALRQQPGAHVLVLGSGGGLLSLLAAQAGAGSVTAVERSRMLFRMAKQCLEANAGGQHAELVGKVHLLDRRLQAVGVQGEELPPDVAAALELQQLQLTSVSAAPANAQQGNSGDAGTQELEDLAVELATRASVLVTDLLDHAVLGAGLLPALDYAAERLLAPGALVVPQRVQVNAVLLELRVGEVSGFDLSSLNAYWWHPGAERLDLTRLPYRCLSAPFPVHTLDLQSRLDARQQSTHSQDQGQSQGSRNISSSRCGGTASHDGTVWEYDATLEVPVIADGHWNAVAFWFELHTGADGSGAVISSGGVIVGTDYGDKGTSPGTEAGTAGAEEAAAATTSRVATSWDPAVQYIDSQVVGAGTPVKLRVRQDSGQYVFTTDPPQCRPRHALVARWHFDMVLDGERNAAYDAAIRRAVRRKRAAGCTDMLALDVGAGSGLLSMMAARAGANSVYGAEVTQHMCDVGEEACIMNGFFNRITMLDRDVRRLDVFRKPDGTPPDLPRRADLLVYEVFDSGCIGEGVLHLLATVQAKLVAADATMVPLSARIFCQPIQMRIGSVLGFDCSQANRWRWRPDYEGLELGGCRQRWVPLAEPVEVFSFDFRQAAAHMQPEEAMLDLHFNAAGVFNAVAMWFELQLDEETSLSTNPYSDKGLTWQQAVQWVKEVEVQPGQQMQLTARHDTYSISYSLPATLTNGGQAEQVANQQLGQLWVNDQVSKGEALAELAAPQQPAPQQTCAPATRPRPTGVPLVDPAWKAVFDRLGELNGQLAKSCVQNPLEYRTLADAAVQLAARPHDLGLDAQQAVEFCVKMMG